jgi:hypothetical protein
MCSCSERESIERGAYEKAKKAAHECHYSSEILSQTPGLTIGCLQEISENEYRQRWSEKEGKQEAGYGAGKLGGPSGTGGTSHPLLNPIQKESFPVPTYDDSVTHPSHYCRGGIELRRVVEAWNLGFYLGNAIKYICRAHLKGNGSRRIEDLRKAIQNITFELERLETEGMERCTAKVAYPPSPYSGCSTKAEPPPYPPGS